MKRLLSILILAGMICSSCEKDEHVNFNLINGTYKGVFYRSSPNTKWTTSNVTITFNANQFNGSSDTSKYPAICKGTYSIIDADTIAFSNVCAWTTEFDWSFILSGKYEISRVDDEIVITRSYGNQTFDVFNLKME